MLLDGGAVTVPAAPDGMILTVLMAVLLQKIADDDINIFFHIRHGFDPEVTFLGVQSITFLQSVLQSVSAF